MPQLPDDEDEIGLDEAQSLFVHQPTLRTLRRWIRDGYGSRSDGPAVYLDGSLINRSYVTSREAIARFKRALKLRNQ